MSSGKKRGSKRGPSPQPTPAAPARSTESTEAPLPPAPPAPAPPAAPISPIVLAFAAALVVLDLAVFLQTRNHGFVSLDDGLYVKENHELAGGLTWASLKWAFTTGRAANWHPLTWISHLLDVQMFGLWAGGHHLTSVVLHTVSTLLCFFGLYRLTGSSGRSFVVAGLFGIHPLHVESVAWISERKDVLSTLFWWLAIGAYAAYARRPEPRRFALVGIALALGLMAKPMLVTLPVTLLLLDVWPLKRIAWPSSLTGMPEPERANWIALVVEKIPLVTIAAVSALVTYLAQQRGGAVIRLGSLPWSMRIFNALLSYAKYLGKAIWPEWLNAFYTYAPTRSLLSILGAAVLVGALTWLVWQQRRTKPYLLAGWLWFLITLVPVIGLVQVGSQALADRYSYITLTGIFVAVVWWIGDAASRMRWPSAVAPAISAAVLLAFAGTAYVQASTWKDSKTLWTHAVAVMPENYVALVALGNIAGQEEKPDEALALFQKAVDANPRYPDSRVNLGYEFLSRGRVDEAIEQYEEALRLNPDFAEGHQNLGIALSMKGRTDEAITHLRQSIALKPNDPSPYVALGVGLLAQQKPADAAAAFSQSLALDPKQPQAHYRLATAQVAMGQTDAAIASFRQALALKPDFPEAHNDLGFLLYALQRTDEAIAECTEAIKNRPDFAEAFYNRGMAYGAKAQVAQAHADFAKAVQLKPGFDAAHLGLGLVLASEGKIAEARHELEEALRINPGNEGARRALSRIR